ncbi:MHYT domain-containing protein [Variovorax sp. 350MFTsu5.1]|uniref:MHYT domain-containing protein n=1 Tax=Variovorax sp. 350MFTsu5.1 TaxID=3158365 RepID=UPI003AB0FD2E
MELLLTPSYNVPLVALSYFISVAGSLIALVAARRIVGPGGRISVYHCATAGLALGGVGVWAMHFIGMLALQLRVGVSYSMFETLISLVAAAAATAIALAYVAASPRSTVRLVVAGILLGMGVVVMHYLGMFGMRLGGFIEWSYPIIGLSALIAVVVATVALWLAFNTRTILMRVLAASVMGAAVCSMHYTGMAAADFICTTATPQAIPSGLAVVSALQLPGWVVMFTVAALFLLALDQFVRHTVESAQAKP